MNIIILGGFLGSGKTTALMQFARYLTTISEKTRKNKVVILENEVGEIGIDDQFLKGGGYTVDTLFAGCACCTVSGELISALVKIVKEMDPEWIVIETTGIAYPRAMRENVQQSLDIDSRIIVLTDASRWRRLRIPMDSLLRGQLEGSDAVLINKTDLVSEEDLEYVEQDILKIEPNAKITRISALGEISTDVWSNIAGIND